MVYKYPDKEDYNFYHRIRNKDWEDGGLEDKYINECILHIKENERDLLLDAGCGLGKQLPKFIPFFKKIVALDPDCKRNAAKRLLPLIRREHPYLKMKFIKSLLLTVRRNYMRHRIVLLLFITLCLSTVTAHAVPAIPAYGLSGLDHVALAVRDLDKSIKFYTEILGFKIKMSKVYDKTENVTAASIKLGQGNTALELIQFHDKNKQLPPLIKNQQPALCPHIGLETIDFNATLEKLKANHVRIIEGPTVVPHDVKLVTIVDPDNYRIDIGQLLK